MSDSNEKCQNQSIFKTAMGVALGIGAIAGGKKFLKNHASDITEAGSKLGNKVASSGVGQTASKADSSLRKGVGNLKSRKTINEMTPWNAAEQISHGPTKKATGYGGAEAQERINNVAESMKLLDPRLRSATAGEAAAASRVGTLDMIGNLKSK